MNSILFENDLLAKIPQVRLGCISFSVRIQSSDEKIKSFSESIIRTIQAEQSIDKVSKSPTIKAAKEAYRKLGKDPSRYRPSAEALTRRVVNGKGLYKVNNVVDILNLISLESGFSIGGYDATKIDGDIEFGIGRELEPYSAIGRGELNIANLPLFRDSLGAFGSPTSDSLRTMVTDSTTQFLMIIIDFDGNESLNSVMARTEELYKRFGVASLIESKIAAAAF